MVKPVCVTCRLFYRPKKNGTVFEEGMPGDNGRLVENGWSSYKLWNGDLWECRQCGSQIIVGCGSRPMREQHHDDYDRVKEMHPPHIFVPDC